MKNLLLIFCTVLAIVSAKGQNLVPNPSFELYDTCPFSTAQIHYATPWFQPSRGTPDCLNSCSFPDLSVPNNFFGGQNAKTGVAYAGFFACFMYST